MNRPYNQVPRSLLFISVWFLFIFNLASFAALERPKQPPKVLADVKISSDTARFEFNMPEAGCVSINSFVKGKKAIERLWGPNWVEAGKQSIPLPAGRVAGRNGTIDRFSVSLSPLATIGRSGRGEKQFIHPTGIGWDQVLKEIYIADTGNDRIIRIGSNGEYVAQYGGFGVSFGDASEEREDSMDEPWDVAPGGFSNFYVTDQNNDRICEFDAYKNFKGTFFPKKGDRRNRLNRPKGLIVDAENNVWVVDGRADRVLKLSPGGEKMLELGGFGWGAWQFKDPTQVAVDNHGNIFVSDRGNHRIQVFDRLGSHIGLIHDQLKSPVGVAIDPDGLVFVCDEKTSEVGIYLPDGRRLQVKTGFGENDNFREPTDLAVIRDFLFVVDSGNNRIVVFSRKCLSNSYSWQVPAIVVK